MLLLRAAWVVPVTTPPIPDGCVAVSDGRIAWVGRRGGPGQPAGPMRDLGSAVLLPGLVNAHCHLELTALAEVGERRFPSFVDWVEALVAARASLDAATAREGARRGIEELLGTGCAAVGDVSNEPQHLDLLRESGLVAVVFLELIGWDSARAASILDRADGRIAELAAPGPVSLRLAAHAPYSVSRPLFAGLVARGGPAAVHLAESAEESRFLRDGSGAWAAFLERRVGHVPFDPPGTSPVRYLDSLGALRPGLLAAHCVQVDAGDRALLARRGVGVAVCPRSNRNLGVGMPAVPELLAAGVALSLGTDSAASAGRLDLMQDVAALQREFPGLEPAVIVRMATLGGAEALGLAEYGSLEPGKRAALAVAPVPEGARDPLCFLTSGEARLGPVGP